MGVSLRILDEDHLEPGEACVLTGWSLPTFRRACRRGLEFLRTGPQPGGKLITSRQAVERYLAKLNGIDPDGPSPDEATAGRQAKGRQRDLARVDRELDAAGI